MQLHSESRKPVSDNEYGIVPALAFHHYPARVIAKPASKIGTAKVSGPILRRTSHKE